MKTCEYCLTFQNSKVNKSESEIKRFCKIIRDFVKLNNKACNKFILSKTFYCNKHNHRISYDVCIDRRERKYCLKNCRQYNVFIKDVMIKLRKRIYRTKEKSND